MFPSYEKGAGSAWLLSLRLLVRFLDTAILADSQPYSVTPANPFFLLDLLQDCRVEPVQVNRCPDRFLPIIHIPLHSAV
jgi:hypothetical protein